MGYNAFSALIIEESASKRSYLWQATLCEPQFGRVKGIKTLEEALARIEDSPKFDVILISDSFPRKRISKFITEAKQSRGKESAYVLVLPDNDKTKETIALSMKDGMDGFLFTPFSVHSLREVAKIADTVKQKYETEKRKTSLKLVVPDITNLLDNISLLKRKEKDLEDKTKELKRLSANLKEIAFGYRDIYIEILMDVCALAPPRKLPSYRGASERVKALLDKKKVNSS